MSEHPNLIIATYHHLLHIVLTSLTIFTERFYRPLIILSLSVSQPRVNPRYLVLEFLTFSLVFCVYFRFFVAEAGGAETWSGDEDGVEDGVGLAGGGGAAFDWFEALEMLAF